MKKREWALIIGLVFAAWFVDFVTKQWALETLVRNKAVFHGFFGLVLHRNPGAMLGMFSDLPPILRIVSLSTGGAFLIFVYASIQYFLPQRSMILRLGMSLLLGGILGNVTDRTISGSVVDFLLLGTPQNSTPAFNVADMIQWVGYFMVVYALLKDGQQIWPNSNYRKRIWINPKFQIKYCIILMVIGLAFAVVSGVFSYTYVQVVIDDLVIGSTKRFETKFLRPFLFTFSIMSFGFVIFLFIVGRILSHRTAGPIYAFEKFLDDLLAGKDRPFKLRTGDEFRHLEELAEDVRERLGKDFTSSSDPRLQSSVDDSPETTPDPDTPKPTSNPE
ncbi:MAG: phosphohydrolase [Bdellovibrionaceae bacterium]|nr:phosphohydrolase [Pseudobdellovibrionaceae bacterium]